MRRTAVLLVALAGVALLWARPAAAGPSWFHTTHASYEPGGSVTLVAHDGWSEDELISGPFHAWLLGNRSNGPIDAPDPLYRHYVGTVNIEATGEGGSFGARLSITFDLPADLEPGIYGFNFCNAACDGQFGALVGGDVYVGVPNPHHSLHWPSWEPEIARLAPDTQISYGGEMVDASVPQAAGWPTEIELETVGPAADPDATPPDPSGMWWHLDEEDLASLASTTSTTTSAPTTTVTFSSSTTSTTSSAVNELAAPTAVAAGSNDEGASLSAVIAIAVVGGVVGAGVAFSVRRRRGGTSAV